MPSFGGESRESEKRRSVAALCLSLAFTCGAASDAASQSSVPPTSATDITSAEFATVLKSMNPDGVSDQQIKVVDIGTYNVAVGILHRSGKAPQGAIAHSQVTEIYYVDGDHVLPAGYVHPLLKK
jgi:hypothetical protein